MEAREQILVVDDDAGIRTILASVLSDEGYEVLEAGDGREALRMVLRMTPGAIILDLNMPVMDGSTFYREIRARGLVMPVVILSAINAVRVARELGASAAVNKPFDLDHLVATLAAVLHPSRN